MSTTLKLHVWPTGIYPRRVMFYLRAKCLPTSVPLEVIEFNIDPKTFTWKDSTGATKPDGTLPSLHVQPPGGAGYWVHEASAILEYLEDMYPADDKTNVAEMRGRSARQRAQTRDAVNIINEATVWSGSYVVHALKGPKPWSTVKERSLDAARDAREMTWRRLDTLEAWLGEARGSEVDGADGARWLADTEGPGIADCSLAALLQYALESYAWEILVEGRHEKLRKWFEMYKEHESFWKEEEVPQWMRRSKSEFEI